MRQVAKLSLDDFLVSQGGDPRDYARELWYKNIPDDLAWETLFGLIGGVSEHNDLTLDLIPEMCMDLGIEKEVDTNDVLDLLIGPVDEVGNDEWEDKVESAIVEAYNKAEQAVRHSSKSDIKERMDDGVVLVDHGDVIDVYDEGVLIEEFNNVLDAEKFINSLLDDWDYKFYYDPQELTVFTWDKDNEVELNWKPQPKPDPRQTNLPLD